MPAPSPEMLGESPVARVLRSLLLALFFLGILTTGAELLLLEHTESIWQWIPLVLMLLGLIILVWYAASRGRLSLRAFQALMGLFVVSGLLGLWLHYQGNVEFELELNAALTGLDLFSEAIRGATPALAPSAMIYLGLLGLGYTYRHPVLQAQDA